MIWQDKGFLLSNIKYNENSSIAEFFTENNGKVVGIIFGASSKKLKSYLLVGNNFHINSNIRENGKIRNYKVEIDKVKTPFYLDNKKKLYCIIYAMNILKILTVENQKNKDLYKLINYFFNLLEDDNWLLNFLFWELQIFKNIGYDINFSNYAKKININADEKFIVESNNKIIPNYLINKNENPKNKNEIIEGFNIVGDFLDKSILKPNNLNYPSSRYDFINLIK